MRHVVCMAITLIFFVGNGCGVSLFVKPEEQAIVDEHIFSNEETLGAFFLGKGGVRAASTRAERRIILFERNPTGVLKVCAEPPAEALQALSSTSDLRAAIEKGKTGGPLSKLSAQGEFGLATAVQSAFRRTQGLQFYRDGAYQLCQALINGLFDGETDGGAKGKKGDYLSQLKKLQKRAADLIEQEIKQPGFYAGQLPGVSIPGNEEGKQEKCEEKKKPKEQECCTGSGELSIQGKMELGKQEKQEKQEEN